MPFKMNCPECGVKLEVEEEWIGTSTPCPVCHKTITIQSPGENSAEVSSQQPPENQNLRFCKQSRKKDPFVLIQLISSCATCAMVAGILLICIFRVTPSIPVVGYASQATGGSGAVPALPPGSPNEQFLACVQNGELELVKYLVETVKVDVNRPRDQERSRTALLIAINKEYDDLAEYLLKHGADPTIKNSSNITPLMSAASSAKDRTKIMELLLKYGAKDLDYALWHMAEYGGNLENFKFLISKGGSIKCHSTTDEKRTLLVHAYRNKQIHLCKYILEIDPAQINTKADYGYTDPLIFCAIEDKNLDFIKYLLKIDSKQLYAETTKGEPPIYRAITVCFYDCVRYFLDQDPKLIDITYSGDSLLGFAVRIPADYELCKMLLERGASVHASIRAYNCYSVYDYVNKGRCKNEKINNLIFNWKK